MGCKKLTFKTLFLARIEELFNLFSTADTIALDDHGLNLQNGIIRFAKNQIAETIKSTNGDVRTVSWQECFCKLLVTI